MYFVNRLTASLSFYQSISQVINQSINPINQSVGLPSPPILPVDATPWSRDLCYTIFWLCGFFKVNFSEPLSFLQRLTEDFEYSECLDKAANAEDVYEQLAYVAAFTVSSYSTTTTRTLKPFNPLLGETYECDRRSDFGWRSLAEQVRSCVIWESFETESLVISILLALFMQILQFMMIRLCTVFICWMFILVDGISWHISINQPASQPVDRSVDQSIIQSIS